MKETCIVQKYLEKFMEHNEVPQRDIIEICYFSLDCESFSVWTELAWTELDMSHRYFRFVSVPAIV